jgi:hypothetical protein
MMTICATIMGAMYTRLMLKWKWSTVEINA